MRCASIYNSPTERIFTGYQSGTGHQRLLYMGVYHTCFDRSWLMCSDKLQPAPVQTCLQNVPSVFKRLVLQGQSSRSIIGLLENTVICLEEEHVCNIRWSSHRPPAASVPYQVLQRAKTMAAGVRIVVQILMFPVLLPLQTLHTLHSLPKADDNKNTVSITPSHV